MPYRDKKLNELCQKARSDNVVDKTLFASEKATRQSLAVATYESLADLLQYRNLTMLEATRLYRASIDVAAISPSDSNDTNFKRKSISAYTWQHTTCPCCDIQIDISQTCWHIRRYFVAYGVLRTCRKCHKVYQYNDYPMPVYYDKFMSLVGSKGNDFAWHVYKPYLTLGLVYDRYDSIQCEKARDYMRHVVIGLLSG